MPTISINSELTNKFFALTPLTPGAWSPGGYQDGNINNTFDLPPGDYRWENIAGIGFQFTVNNDGRVSVMEDESFEWVEELLEGGMGTLSIHGRQLRVNIDLTNKHFTIPGATNGYQNADEFSIVMLLPGPYQLALLEPNVQFEFELNAVGDNIQVLSEVPEAISVGINSDTLIVSPPTENGIITYVIRDKSPIPPIPPGTPEIEFFFSFSASSQRLYLENNQTLTIDTGTGVISGDAEVPIEPGAKGLALISGQMPERPPER